MTSVPSRPPWLNVAVSMIGIREIPGRKSNPIILGWVKDLGAPRWYDDDDKAWCALFANKVCQASGLPLSGKGFALLRAASFATWGVPLLEPTLGALLVFDRKGGHHVGWYLGERRSDGALRVVGGNQGNCVREDWIDKDRLADGGIRWPNGWPLPTAGRVYLADNGGALSTDES